MSLSGSVSLSSTYNFTDPDNDILFLTNAGPPSHGNATCCAGSGDFQETQLHGRALHARALGADVDLDQLGLINVPSGFNRLAQQAALDSLVLRDQLGDAQGLVALIEQ